MCIRDSASPLEDSRPQSHEDAPQEEPREKPGSRHTRYQQKFSESSSASEAAAEQPRTSKLQFAEDELPPDAPGKKLVKARQKAERTDVYKRQLTKERKFQMLGELTIREVE